MNTPNLLQQTLEKMDFNQLESSPNYLFLALEKLNHRRENNSPNLLQTLLFQSFSRFNDACHDLNDPPPFLEMALQHLNHGVVGIQETEEEILLHDEELPALPDLGEDILATETMPISNLFLSIKTEYKEPRSFVLEQPATHDQTPAVITAPLKIEQPAAEIKRNTEKEITKSQIKQTQTFDLSKATQFFENLPFEKALPKIKVVEQDTGEETHFRILPAKQNTLKNDKNLVENPIFAATLQAIQSSGGTVPTVFNESDFKTVKSQSFFSSLPWARKTA